MMPKNKLNKITLLASIILVYIVNNFIKLRGVQVYIIKPVFFILLSIITVSIFNKKNIFNMYDKSLIYSSLMIAVSQISFLIFIGVIMGLGKSPYSFAPISIVFNVLLFSSRIIGTEFSRTALVNSARRKKALEAVYIYAIIFTLFELSYVSFTGITGLRGLVTFMGSKVIPTLTKNILASYLALLGTASCSIAYLLPIEAFWWLSPVLPNIEWIMMSLVATMFPIVGYLFLDINQSPYRLWRKGLITRREVARRDMTESKEWIVVLILGVVVFWGSTGLLGFQPRIVASGSMRPSLEVGDLVIAVPTPTQNIEVGDVVLFITESGSIPIIHRVIEIETDGNEYMFVTKGDANNAPDDPIFPADKVFKLAYTVPYVGWFSIYTRQFVSDSFSYIAENVLVSLLSGSILLVLGGFIVLQRRFKVG